MLFCSIFALSFASASYAQEEEQTNALEEVIVTAQKREESLQKTALAVSVMSGTFLEDNRIDDFIEVTSRIPGFSVTGPAKTQPGIALRGAGSLEDSAGIDQAVGIFIDDVYISAPSAFDSDLFDLERVEVLRGPQGTLFGKNVVGGAINFITRNPTQEKEASLQATYGRFNRFDVRGSVSGPLIDDELFGLISFSSRNSDGYTYNEFTDNMLDQDNEVSGRSKLLWTATEDFEILLSADYYRDKSYGISRAFLGPVAPIIGTLNTDPLVVNHDQDGGYDRTIWGMSAKMSYSFDDGGEIVSITAYRNSEQRSIFDLDGTTAPTLHFDSSADSDQFSQELRYVNDWGDLDYIVGLYYFDADNSQLESFEVEGQPGSLFAALIESIIGVNIPLPETLGQNISTKSYAIFAEGTYSFSDTFRVTLGGRYTWEDKSGNTFCSVPGFQCELSAYDVDVGDSWSAFTPKLTVAVDITDEILGYATVSNGFKSGGFVTGTEAEALLTFDPEEVWNYELGLKSRWFEDRLQVNVAGYFAEYSDLQFRFSRPDGLPDAGTADTENYGLEVEVMAIPIEGLDVWANYAYQEGEYTDLLIDGEQLAGNRTILTPKHSLSLGSAYTVYFSDGGSLTLAGDYTHKSLSLVDPSGDERTGQEINGLVDAYIAYTFPDEAWEIKFSGKNLTNEGLQTTISSPGVFVIPALDTLSGATTYNTHYSAPITWAVTVSFRY